MIILLPQDMINDNLGFLQWFSIESIEWVVGFHEINL
jgi:hypothetical protein